MQIPPLGAVAPVRSPFRASGASSPLGAGGAQGSSFGDMITKGLQSVSASENNADSMVQGLAAGKPIQAADVMIATSQAGLSVQMLVAVRDQALGAYKEIMNMQV
jgi:flagellar hook-basal body complex protein FliE